MALKKAATPAEDTTDVAVNDVNNVNSAKEVAISDVRFDDEQLRNIGTFEEAMAAAAAAYGSVENITDHLGNGFRLLPENEKGRLVGVTFIILYSSINNGNFGEFASLALVTRNNDRLILNDGGKGIPNNIKDLQNDTKRMGGWAVPHGLRSSEYDCCPEHDGGCGKPRKLSELVCPNPLCKNESTLRGKGETFYLDTSE